MASETGYFLSTLSFIRCHHEPSFQKRHSWVRDWAWLCAFCRLKAVSRLFWSRMWAGFDDDKGCRHPNGRVITKNFFGSVGFDFLIFYLILAFQPCHPLSYTHISFGTCATGVCALPSINITGCRWRGFAIATAACVPWPFLPERDEYILWCTCLETPPPFPVTITVREALHLHNGRGMANEGKLSAAVGTLAIPVYAIAAQTMFQLSID